MLAGASLVVGSRMHACLNALSVGTPAVPLAYSRKFAPLMADLGWEHVIDLRAETGGVGARVTSIVGRDDLDTTVAAVAQRARASLAPAAALLADRVTAGVQ